MLWVLDIGNTNSVCGFFEGQNLKETWRFPTDAENLKNHILKHSHDKPQVPWAISSVAPRFKGLLTEILEDPFFITHEKKLPITLSVDSPIEVGADRIANSAYAIEKFPDENVIVIDFGTATTFDVIGKNKEYLGGPIAPGVRTALSALTQKAEKLDSIEIDYPKRVIGKNTVECLQSGIVHGYMGLIEHLSEQILLELNGPAKIVATGGLAEFFARESSAIQLVDDHWTLRGIAVVWRFHLALAH